MKFDIMTLFPEMVSQTLKTSILGRAQEKGIIEIACHNMRDYSKDKHHNVDDTPAGGGMGMVLTAQPIYDCYQEIIKDAPKEEKRRVIYLSPKGRVFHQRIAKEMLGYDRIVLLCGHYEGVDQRVLDTIVDEDISIGDYVLTGGELPACVLVDAVSRLVDGVLSDKACHEEESIASGLLEYPQYTRPTLFLNQEIPDVLLSGNHAEIKKWRDEKAYLLTEERRPDLITPEMRKARAEEQAKQEAKERKRQEKISRREREQARKNREETEK